MGSGGTDVKLKRDSTVESGAKYGPFATGQKMVYGKREEVGRQNMTHGRSSCASERSQLTATWCIKSARHATRVEPGQMHNLCRRSIRMDLCIRIRARDLGT